MIQHKVTSDIDLVEINHEAIIFDDDFQFLYIDYRDTNGNLVRKKVKSYDPEALELVLNPDTGHMDYVFSEPIHLYIDKKGHLLYKLGGGPIIED